MSGSNQPDDDFRGRRRGIAVTAGSRATCHLIPT